MDALLRDPSGSAPKASRQRVAITQMNLALDPELARKEEWRKLGHTPKNHMQENYKAMRRTQSAARRRKAEAEARANPSDDALRKPKTAVTRQFKDTPSRVATAAAAKAVPRTKDFLKPHSKLGPPSKPEAPVVTRAKPPPRPGAAFGQALTPEQLASDMQGMAVVGSRPASASRASRAGSALSSRASSRPGTAKKPGQIPKYLRERKAAWASEAKEKRAVAADPDCPPGCAPLSGGARRALLESLRKKHAALSARVQALPMAGLTHKTRVYKEQLESDMLQVEGALRFFSSDKNQVYARVN